jgi:hypothetical protein
VIDIDGNTFTAQFLNSATQVKDTFRIVKGTACPPTPAPACGTAPKGKLIIRNNADPAGDKWIWKWKNGTVNAPDLGDPTQQTDLAVCVYDAGGPLVGGSILHGAPEWSSRANGFSYRDNTLARHGFKKIKLRHGTGWISTLAKGAAAGVPTLAATFPVRAQLVNLDSGACWESTFASATKNTADKIVAKLP